MKNVDRQELLNFYQMLSDMAIIDDEYRNGQDAKLYVEKFINSAPSESQSVVDNEQANEICCVKGCNDYVYEFGDFNNISNFINNYKIQYYFFIWHRSGWDVGCYKSN